MNIKKVYSEQFTTKKYKLKALVPKKERWPIVCTCVRINYLVTCIAIYSVRKEGTWARANKKRPTISSRSLSNPLLIRDYVYIIFLSDNNFYYYLVS